MIDGSLLRNITLDTVDDAEIRKNASQALSMAGLDSYLKQLGEGLDTRIGEAGANISGGKDNELPMETLL